MPKTKQVGLRISLDIYNRLKNLTESLRISFSDLLERIILFFLHNQQTVLEFHERDPNEIEFMELSGHEEWSLQKLKAGGISSRGQLYWVAHVIQRTWSNANGTATSSWVINILKALKLLLEQNITNINELMPYLKSTFPEHGNLIDEKIDNAFSNLSRNARISSFYADFVARCFLAIIRDGKFQLTADTLVQINNLLTPWFAWVMQRSINITDARDIDISLILKPASSERKYLSMQRQTVSVQVFLSGAGQPPFFSSQSPFSCSFSFYRDFYRDDKSLIATFACTAQRLFELFEVVRQLKDENKIIAIYGHWEIKRSERENTYTVKILGEGGALIAITKRNIDDLMDLVEEMYQIEEIQRDLIKEYLEVYGAL